MINWYNVYFGLFEGDMRKRVKASARRTDEAAQADSINNHYFELQ
jgi:hypothetical protein